MTSFYKTSLSKNNLKKKILRDQSNTHSIKKFSKSKSTSNIKDLLLQDDAFTLYNSSINLGSFESKPKETIYSTKCGQHEFMDFLEKNCTKFEKFEFFEDINHIAMLHYALIKKFKSTIGHNTIKFPESSSNRILGAYEHIDFRCIVDSLLYCSKNNSSTHYLNNFVINLIYYLFHTNIGLKNVSIFEIGLKSMCSLFDNQDVDLGLICLALFKIIEENGETQYTKKADKYSIILKLNNLDNEFELELRDSKSLANLSIKYRIELCMKLLKIIVKDNQVKVDKLDLCECIGSIRLDKLDTEIFFWNYVHCPQLIFIVKNSQEISFLRSLNSNSYFKLIEYIKKSLNIQSTTSDENNNSILNLDLFKSELIQMIDKRNHLVILSSQISNNESMISNPSLINDFDLKKFTLEAEIYSEFYNNLLNVDLDVGLLIFIKRLLLSNLTNYEINLRNDNSIESFRLNSFFESNELKILLDSVLVNNQLKFVVVDTDSQVEPIFGHMQSPEWQSFGNESLKVDLSLTDQFNLNIKLNHLKTLIESMLNIIKTTDLNSKFLITRRRETWINSVKKAQSNSTLRLSLYFLYENIKWSNSIEADICILCNHDSNKKCLKEIFRNPYNLVKQKCNKCGIVVHLNCLMNSQFRLYECENLSSYLAHKNYVCIDCHDLNQHDIWNSRKSVHVNTYTLRNTDCRKRLLVKAKIFKEPDQKKNKKKLPKKSCEELSVKNKELVPRKLMKKNSNSDEIIIIDSKEGDDDIIVIDKTRTKSEDDIIPFSQL